MTTEIWKNVEGYEGFYQVSNLGNVRSLDRGRRKGRILKPQPCTQVGYLAVVLCKDSHRKRFYVAHLVAHAFIGPKPSPDLHCRHLDDNRMNNCESNLAWGTPLENKEDARRNGGIAKGEQHGISKLTEQAVRVIKSKLGSVSQDNLAKEYGVSQKTISNIATGRTWGYV